MSDILNMEGEELDELAFELGVWDDVPTRDLLHGWQAAGLALEKFREMAKRDKDLWDYYWLAQSKLKKLSEYKGNNIWEWWTYEGFNETNLIRCICYAVSKASELSKSN